MASMQSGQKTATDTPDAGIDVKDKDPKQSWHSN